MVYNGKITKIAVIEKSIGNGCFQRVGVVGCKPLIICSVKVRSGAIIGKSDK